MRCSRVLPLLLLGIALSLAWNLPASRASSEISVILDPWPPFTLGETGGPPTSGLLMDVASELFGRAGIPYRITVYPWNRCLLYMQAGDADLLLGVTKKPEREEYMLYSIPLFVDRIMLFYSKERFPEGFSWNSFEDLKGKLIGVTSGYNMGEAFISASKEIPLEIDTAEGEPQNFIKLYRGRYDLFACYEISGHFWVNANPDLQEQVRVADKPVLENLAFYLAISRKSKAVDLMPKIDAAIGSMTADGTMNRLLGLGGK